MTKRTDWTKAEIRANLEASDKWLCHGLIAIFNKQTEDEKQDGRTSHDNGIGFNGVDAEILSNALAGLSAGRTGPSAGR